METQPVLWRHRATYSYQDYLLLFEQVVAAGRTTGPHQTEELAQYTKLNLARTHRIEGHTILNDELKAELRTLHAPQTWLVLTECWCGDAAQSLPYLHALASASGYIHLRLLLRDENPGLMDQFLTGTSRSIPKLVALDAQDRVLFTWGPRPASAQAIMNAYLANPIEPKEQAYEALHKWYAQNKGADILAELKALLKPYLG